jgi:hypothetical protein
VIDELKFVHYCLSVRLRRSIVRRQFQSPAPSTPLGAAHRRRRALIPAPSKALIAAPGESTAEFDFIARRFMEGTQAFVATNEKKKSLKLVRMQKKPRIPENSRRAYDTGDLAAFRTLVRVEAIGPLVRD